MIDKTYDRQRAFNAASIAKRYMDNIRKTKAYQREVRGGTFNDRVRANNKVRVSRSTYMGLSNG